MNDSSHCMLIYDFVFHPDRACRSPAKWDKMPRGCCNIRQGRDTGYRDTRYRGHYTISSTAVAKGMEEFTMPNKRKHDSSGTNTNIEKQYIADQTSGLAMRGSFLNTGGRWDLAAKLKGGTSNGRYQDSKN